jgi:hypothetical protein
MRHFAFITTLFLAFLGLSAVSSAQGYSTVTGTLATVMVESTVGGLGAEIVSFKLTNQPTSTGCANSGYFIFSAADVTDANTRKNMLAALLAARVSGATVSIVYGGTACDSQFGYAIPVAISL